MSVVHVQVIERTQPLKQLLIAIIFEALFKGRHIDGLIYA